jgi:hypothetical protein
MLTGGPLLGAEGIASASPIHPAATSVTLSEVGAGPTTLSLSWTESGDVFFSSYTLQESTAGSNGPWSVIATITTKASTSEYIYGQVPGTTYWWEIVDTDSFGNATSNTLQFAQPSVATLSYSLPTSTSARLAWNNEASYAGYVGFGSYTVLEAVNGGSPSTVTTLTSESATSYTVNGLSTSTNYSFSVTTTDDCVGCSGGSYPSSSSSNPVSFKTSSPVSASASASPVAVDVGQSVSLSCTAGGGVPPYTYSWAFGDGTTGSGQSPTHTYTASGSMTAVCTADDSASSSATGATTVTVDALPSVSSPVATPSSPLEGSSLTLTVTASGGSGGLKYTWSGLPSGCTSSDSPTVSCTPSNSGTFSVTVSVQDSNGGTVTSQALSLTVAASFLGQTQAQGFELLSGVLVAVLVVVILVIALILLRRRRKLGGPPQPYQQGSQPP